MLCFSYHFVIPIITNVMTNINIIIVVIVIIIVVLIGVSSLKIFQPILYYLTSSYCCQTIFLLYCYFPSALCISYIQSL